LSNEGNSGDDLYKIVYQPGDKYRGMPHCNCILLNSEDTRSIGIDAHNLVTVKGDAGKLERVEVIYGNIRRGAAMMFYPEVNAIFTAQVDPQSGTPAFKRVPIAVYL
jgi:anaerobic selenocysteine-containing dehydrogenase